MCAALRRGPPFRSRHDDLADAAALHAAEEVIQALVRPHCRWPGFHDFLRCDNPSVPARPHAPEHDVLGIDDRTGLSPSSATGGFGPACRRGQVRDFQRSAWAGIGSHGRQPGSEPVDLPGGVVVHVEVQALEPPRGPWTHVSQAVPAVDDHRAYAVENVGDAVVQLLERQMDRLGEVLLVVLGARKNLDQLCSPMLHEAKHLIAIDDLRQRVPYPRRALDEPPAFPITPASWLTDGAPTCAPFTSYSRHDSDAVAPLLANGSRPSIRIVGDPFMPLGSGATRPETVATAAHAAEPATPWHCSVYVSASARARVTLLYEHVAARR